MKQSIRAAYYLYIKTSPYGLKYLGKTTKDPFVYMGSGKIWLRHIKKHNLTLKDIQTEIVFETTDVNALINEGIKLSNDLNIVKSSEWANLRVESGDGGDTSKFINYSNPVFHEKNRSDHLNGIGKTEEERKILFKERSQKIDYENIQRLQKIKDNTDWESWYESIKNRKTDYAKSHENLKKPILVINIISNKINEYKSLNDASEELGIKSETIRKRIQYNRIIDGCKWVHKNEIK
jgi:hypothetical protein